MPSLFSEGALVVSPEVVAQMASLTLLIRYDLSRGCSGYYSLQQGRANRRWAELSP